MTEQVNFVNHFKELLQRNVNDFVEKKMKLNYLKWSFVQQELQKLDENFEQRINTFPHPDIEGFEVPYLCTPEGYFVSVTITLFGKTKTEILPVLDQSNRAVKKGQADTFQINKAQKRCFVKCAAQFGLGLYIYHGDAEPDQTDLLIEDLKEGIEIVRTLLSETKDREMTYDEVKDGFKIGKFEELTNQQVVGYLKMVRKQIASLSQSSDN